MMKKCVILLFAVIIMAFGAVSVNAVSGTCGNASWSIDDEGTLEIYPTNGKSGRLKNNDRPWYEYRNSIIKVVVKPGVIASEHSSELFADLSECMEMDLSGLDTSKVTSMREMFSGCTYLESIVFGSNWDTSRVMFMDSMFSGCKNLIELNLSNWKTSEAYNMSNMFEYCEYLEKISFGDVWDTSGVHYMDRMFYGCNNLIELNIEDWNTSRVESMSFLFSECWELTTLNLEGWDTSKVTDMAGMFNLTSSLKELKFGKSWNTKNVTNMGGMFCGTGMTELNLNDWDTSNVENMAAMFWEAYQLKQLNLGKLWNTSKVMNMMNMFNGCASLTELNVDDGWYTSNVTLTANMFMGCESLKALKFGTGWDTSNVTAMFSMFDGCNDLSYIEIPDCFVTTALEMYPANPNYNPYPLLPDSYIFTADDPSSPLNGQSFTQIQSGVAGVYTKPGAGYSVNWKNNDTILETDSNVINGTAPEYNGEAPNKASDTEYSYNFIGWSTDSAATVGTAAELLPAVTSDVTYYAIFEKIANKWANPFTDVSETDWYYTDIEFVNKNGLMNGIGNNQFAPANMLNRATIVTTLWRLAGSPIVETEMNFTDLPTDWYTEAMKWAISKEIIRGYGDNTCKPLTEVTHEQVVAILHRYITSSGYADNITATAANFTYSDWAVNDVLWAVSNNIFEGFGVDITDLTKSANRAEIAAYLRRLSGLIENQ